MLTSLITRPIRAGLRGAELGVRVGQTVTERAIALVGAILMPTARQPAGGGEAPSRPPRARNDGSSGAEPRSSPPERAAAPRSPAPESRGGDPRSAASAPEHAVTEQAAVAAARPAPAASEPPAPAPPVPAATQPAHVDQPVAVVDELAEPGAEDGAGAEIHVAEPWDGYAQLKAADVVRGLAGRTAAELAAVELYEQAHRRRQTVLEAAQREFRRLQNAP